MSDEIHGWLDGRFPLAKTAGLLRKRAHIFSNLSRAKARGGVVPSIVGDEWKTAYSAGFNSTTCALVRLEENLAGRGVKGKMGVIGEMGGCWNS